MIYIHKTPSSPTTNHTPPPKKKQQVLPHEAEKIDQALLETSSIPQPQQAAALADPSSASVPAPVAEPPAAAAGDEAVAVAVDEGIVRALMALLGPNPGRDSFLARSQRAAATGATVMVSGEMGVFVCVFSCVGETWGAIYMFY